MESGWRAADGRKEQLLGGCDKKLVLADGGSKTVAGGGEEDAEVASRGLRRDVSLSLLILRTCLEQSGTCVLKIKGLCHLS